MSAHPRRIVQIFTAAVIATTCGPNTDDSDATSAATVGSSMTMQPTTGGPDSSSGASEESGAGTTAAPPTTAECMQDSDCTLINNCCQCDSQPIDAPVAPCEGNCLQSTCDALSLGGVRVACRSGVCEFADVTCGEGPVACDQVMPTCPAGTRVSVQDSCWGPCVHPRYCAGEACPAEGCGAGWTCVEHQASAADCVVVPFECGDMPGCTCVAPYLQEFCPASCVDDGGGLLCQDGG